MNIVLWVLQVLLAVGFALHGWMYVAPSPEIKVMLDTLLPGWFRIFIGVAELLAAVGLILPGATRIMPWLTPLAAAGLMIVMASASVLHAVRGETSNAIMAAVILVLVTIVAYMRWRVLPIPARDNSVTARQVA